MLWVVAVAIHCGANLIVTFNLKDFPADALAPYNLTAKLGVGRKSHILMALIRLIV